jgi:hypothetical protein
MSIFKSITPTTNTELFQSDNICDIIKNGLTLDKQIDTLSNFISIALYSLEMYPDKEALYKQELVIEIIKFIKLDILMINKFTEFVSQEMYKTQNELRIKSELKESIIYMKIMKDMLFSILLEQDLKKMLKILYHMF